MEANHRLGFCVWPITNDAKFAMVYHKNYVIMMPFPLVNWEWTKVLLGGKNWSNEYLQVSCLWKYQLSSITGWPKSKVAISKGCDSWNKCFS